MIVLNHKVKSLGSASTYSRMTLKVVSMVPESPCDLRPYQIKALEQAIKLIQDSLKDPHDEAPKTF